MGQRKLTEREQAREAKREREKVRAIQANTLDELTILTQAAKREVMVLFSSRWNAMTDPRAKYNAPQWRCRLHAIGDLTRAFGGGGHASVGTFFLDLQRSKKAMFHGFMRMTSRSRLRCGRCKEKHDQFLREQNYREKHRADD